MPSTVTIIVTTTADEWTDPGPGTGCALREAIRAAGNHASFGGSCTYSGSGEITISWCLPVHIPSQGMTWLVTDVTINGVGWNATIIDGNNHTRIFFTMHLCPTLNDMTLKNGRSMEWGRMEQRSQW